MSRNVNVKGTNEHEADLVTAPLTPTQRDLYLDHLLNPTSTTFNIATSVRLPQAVDSARWKATVHATVAAQPATRTLFSGTGDQLRQHIALAAAFCFEQHTHADWDAADIRRFIEGAMAIPMDPARGPLFKNYLFQTNNGDYAAVVTPHLVFDGVSMQLFFEQVWQAYQAAGATTEHTLIAGDFFHFARQDFSAFDATETKAFWEQRLANVAPLELQQRGDHDAPNRYRHMEIGATETANLRAFLAEHNYRLPAFFLTLYGLLLQRYADHADDFVIRTITAGRPAEFSRTLGCFYQAVPYVFPTEPPSGKADPAQLFDYVHSYRRSLGERQNISVLLLNTLLKHETLKPYFNFQTFAASQTFGQRAMQVYMSHPRDELHLAVTDWDETLGLELYYNDHSFPDLRFLERLAALAKQICGTNNTVAELDILLEDERTHYQPRPRPKPPVFVPVHNHFQTQAEQRPDAPALLWNNQTISYAECHHRSNQLAHFLTTMGVGLGTPVGLCLERSAELVLAVLAIVKAGGTYVPMDPDSPAERMQFIATDASIPVVVTQTSLAGNFSGTNAQLICVDCDAADIAQQPVTNLPCRVTADTPVYIIYTSGSTGRPKGVPITHGNLARLFDATAPWFGFNEHDVWTLFHSIAFDFSVWELWGALRYGGQLVIVPNDVCRTPQQFFELVRHARVTVLNQTPAAFYQLIRAAEEAAAPPTHLRCVIFGGEALAFAKLKPWFALYGDQQPQLVNMYGITETTVHVTYRPLTQQDALASTGSLIGVPIPDLEVFVLDRALRPRPPGLAGELCISGAGVACGYLERPALTAERFIPNPFSQDATTRLYRSGDLGRWLPNERELEHLGRVDQQIKIRGYRIEAGELEAVLCQHPSVQTAVVIAGDDPLDSGSKQLIAYLVPKGPAPAPSRLREFLTQRLPSYMIPTAFVILEHLPLTLNGKVDRRALPAPNTARPELEQAYLAPRDATEQALAEIWTEILHVERVGIQDSFFDLGGHSLAAVQLIGRVREKLGRDLPLCRLFESPTIAALARLLRTEVTACAASMLPPLVPAPRDRPLPLSFSQERVWFLQKMFPDIHAYEFTSTLRFTGKLHLAALEQALTEIVRRHEIYRTTFVENNGQPTQVIHPAQTIGLPLIDLTSEPPQQREPALRRQIRAAMHQPFVLDRLPLVRWTLIRLHEEEHILIHNEHHILHDGWSFILFLRELLMLYRALATGQPSPLPEPKVQFADFACWQRAWLRGEFAAQQLSFWRAQLADAPVTMSLPFDRPRPALQSFRGAALQMELPAAEALALEEFSRQHGVTLYMTLLASFLALLYRYTGEEDLVVGTGVANRRTRETEELFGMILNNIALRTDLRGNPPFTELLQRVKRVTLDAYAHQDVPFDQVVEAVNPPRSMSHAPIFQVLFTSYDGTIPDLELPGMTVRLDEGLNNGSAKFDLNIIAISRSRHPTDTVCGGHARPILLIWEYNTDLFDAETMERMLASYRRVLDMAVRQPDRQLSHLPLTDAAEQQRLLHEWSGTTTTYPRDKSIQELFEEQARCRPQATALVFGEQRMSYRELNERANQVAQALIKRGVGPDVLVGLCLERSPDMIIGLLGILKAGGAYVPLDPAYPRERLAFMLQDTAISILVTQQSLRERLPLSATTAALCLDSDAPLLKAASNQNPIVRTTAENLAYVMYTSGSTGQPKGVCVPHCGVVRLVKNTNYVKLSPDETLLQFAPISFDASTFEIFGSLLNGAQLVIAPPQLLSLDELGLVIKQQGITTLWLTAALFQQMAERALEHLSSVRQLLAGGDVLPVAAVKRVLQHFPHCQIINGYGPTESTTFACCHTIATADLIRENIPIGQPIANSQAYILDRDLQPTPLGVAGELYLGGDGLARGYLHDAALTAQRFIPHPFSQEPNARLYKTGDRARWLPNRRIEFLGRMDQQVKIRGFRVEPGEVEAALRQHSDIKDVVVIAHQHNVQGKRLIAYVVRREGAPTGVEIFRNYLREKLPDYMIPAVFICLPALPLTANGKVNRRGLPTPTALDEAYSNQKLALVDRPATTTSVFLALPYGRPRALAQHFRDARLQKEISLAETLALEEFSRVQGVTTPTTLLTAFLILLHRYTDEKAIVIGARFDTGSTRKDKASPDVARNTLTLHLEVDGDRSSVKLLPHVRQAILEATAPCGISHTSRLQVLFTAYDGLAPDLRANTFPEGPNTAAQHADLHLIVRAPARPPADTAADRPIALICEYNSELFDAATIKRMLGHYHKLLEGLVRQPDWPPAKFPLLAATEEKNLLEDWCGGPSPYPRDKCLHELFEEQVRITPDAVAIVYDQQHLSYRELNDRANQLAHVLIKHGIGPDALVGLCVERSLEMIVGILGILKAGGAYVPFNLADPRDRLTFILQDTAITVLVTQRRCLEQLPVTSAITSICLDTDADMLAVESTRTPDSKTTAENLAYVMYTSGSTGKPKGVCVPHRGTVRLVKQTNYVSLTSEEVVLQFTPVSFDISTFEIFGSLLNGAKLILPPPQLLSFDELGLLIKKYSVTLLSITPNLFQQLVEGPIEHLGSVRQLISGGDTLPAAPVKRMLQRHPHCRIINGYGPTEDSAITCAYTVTADDHIGENIPIGRSIPNSQAYILDRHLQLTPIGVAGELHTTGDGLARGYLNAPELTASRFIPHPFSKNPKARLYKTGDRARWLPNGQMEFLGRLDHQVKIRGFRVEPGEIEATLRQHPEVKDVIITVQKRDHLEKQLIAYIVARSKAAEQIDPLRAFLREKLPDYMIPAAFVFLPILPVTTNGKVNTAALPPPFEQITAGDNVPQSHTPTEQKLTAIWCEVLGLPRIGRHDNFFDCGGHSLLALRLIARIREAFQVDLPVRSLFEAPTIATLAERLKTGTNTRPWQYLLEIKTGGTHPPIFFLPGGAGGEKEYTIYARMLRQLDGACPVYGFVSGDTPDNTQPPVWTADLIAAYLREVRTVQPTGPYYLLGECSGGIAAFEMAHQLRAQGQTVALLGLLDARPPHRNPREIQFYRRYYTLLLAGLDCWPHRPSTTSLFARLRNVVAMRAAYWNTIAHYQPKPYQGKITLLASTQLARHMDLRAAWRDLAQGEWELHILPGGHKSYIRDHAPATGQILRTCLEKIWSAPNQ